MSQLAPLLEKLKESGAERVVYAPNELAYACEGEVKRPLPGSPVKGAIILEAISEVLSQDDISGLSTARPRIVRYEHDGDELVLEIVRTGSGISLAVRHARPATRGAPRGEVIVAPKKAPEAAPAPPAPAPVIAAPPPQQPEARAAAAAAAAAGSSKRQSKKMRAAEGAVELDLDSRGPVKPRIDPKIQDLPNQDRIDTQPALREATAATNAQPAAPVVPSQEIMQLARDIARDAAREAARETARDIAREAAREVARDAAREAAREVVREEIQNLQLGGGGGSAASGNGKNGGFSFGALPAASGPALSERALGAPAKIDSFLREMIQKKASDLHLTSDAHPVFRIDGAIQFEEGRNIMSSADILAMVMEIMTNRARADYQSVHDADFAYEISGLARFRVNVFQDRNGTGAVFRQIPIEIHTAEALGLPKACFDMCWLSKGLVLVTGPTGSGKSTTLAAMIDFINRNRGDHIITIEDPVEFVHHNQKCLINQREVGQHTSSFKHALRAALREDPDIVLVGELRDLETIAIAIETAETGHLVFGTLHTTTAISTIDRIIDQFPADRQDQIRVMLSESLKGVIAQVLLPKIGGGRVAAHEILISTTAVASMIREGKTFQLASTMQTSKGLGMVTMNDALMNLVMKKLVDPKQAYMRAVDKNGFVTMLRSAGIQPPI